MSTSLNVIQIYNYQGDKPYDDESSLCVESNEIAFYVGNWSSSLTVDMINQHRNALQELETRIKAIDSSITANPVEAFASYN